MRSRQRMFAAVMRLLLKCLRLGRRRRFKLVRQVEQLWQYGHLCLRSLLYNSFTNGDVVLDSLFEPVYWLVDHVTRWFGVVFVALVIGLTSSIVAIVYICLLPLILQTYTPAWICWHLAYGHWNLIMIVFHYYMAITTSPGHPPQEMHCPQAGSHPPLQHLQQRMKLLDKERLQVAANQTYYQTPPPTFSFHQRAFHKSVVYLWVLCSSVALALGALTLWHAALITRGETSIERHINKKERQRLQKKGKVSAACGAGRLAGAELDVTCVSPACRSSGTPTVMAAGITGRCSWAWTCQGKAPEKPLPGKVVAQQRVGVLGHWGSPWVAGAEQDSEHPMLCSALGFARQGGPRHLLPCGFSALPVANSGLPSTPLPRESWLRSSAIVAARGHGLTALAWLCRAEKR
ncbi:palmitoyltransferase ZDHHC16 isoform X4 [Calonectris borealis]|uniref:palmitoyltransferase ZDHHC16 isoform X4 n=1 Tax=Calonectris borealis TaxID=1323832 RepID=UPI003F4B729F